MRHIATVPVSWTGSRLLVNMIPGKEFRINLSGCCGDVKLVGSRRPLGKLGKTRFVFLRLSTGNCVFAVRGKSTQPTVQKTGATANEAGYLLHGPYIGLRAGDYVGTVFCAAHNKGVAYIDVAASQGGCNLA